MTEKEKQELLEGTEELDKATVYLSAVSLGLSMICLWAEQAEDELRKLGFFKFSFKQDYNRCENMMNNLEISLRQYGIDNHLLSKYFDIVEPKLIQYLFEESKKCNKQNQEQI